MHSDIIQYVSMRECRLKERTISEVKAMVTEQGLSNVSWQMRNWMTKNGYGNRGQQQQTNVSRKCTNKEAQTSSSYRLAEFNSVGCF